VDLEGRVAVVTGGASGMGAAVAEHLRRAGASLVVWDLAPSADVVCDIGDPQAVDAALTTTIDRAGVPTVVTTCAGIGDGATLLDADAAVWDRVFAVNARGSWLVLRACARALIERELDGSLIAFSSISARLSDRGMGMYCASKAALDMLVRVAAAEWGGHGIRVNAIAPGVTDTPMIGGASRIPGWLDAVAGRTPLGRVGLPDDVAAVAVAIHRLDWVTGESIAADGGLRLHSPIDSFGAVEAARNRRTDASTGASTETGTHIDRDGAAQ
jgi:NAD(P)-dependent dehydrogenase (short-subunit alcohol dehydrogenase family)